MLFYHHHQRINSFDTLQPYYLLPMEPISQEMYYWNRTGSFVLGPESSGSETGLHGAFRMRFACDACSTPEAMSCESCVSGKSDSVVEMLKFVALRPYERCVRRRFDGAFEPSSINLFLGLHPAFYHSLCLRSLRLLLECVSLAFRDFHRFLRMLSLPDSRSFGFLRASCS